MGQRTTDFSQRAEFLIPFHSLFHTTDGGGILRCRSIGQSNTELPLLAKLGFETRKLAGSQNLQEIYVSLHHQVGIQALASHLDSGMLRHFLCFSNVSAGQKQFER